MPPLRSLAGALRALCAAAAAVAACLLGGCGRAGGDAAPGGEAGREAEEARLYAAASLTDVLASLVREFEPGGGCRVVAGYGASNTLALQIREGAAPGVFVSASAEWADRLEEWGLVEPGSRTDLLGNALVVVVPRGASGPPATLADLAAGRFDRIALADPAAVPAGRYATSALEKAGVLASVRARIVAAQDVRTALAYVERGEAPAGIVYATDAAASRRVDVAFRVPAELHPRIVYPMVLVKGAGRASRDLHAFLRSEAARTAFDRAGFTRP